MENAYKVYQVRFLTNKETGEVFGKGRLALTPELVDDALLNLENDSTVDVNKVNVQYANVYFNSDVVPKIKQGDGMLVGNLSMRTSLDYYNPENVSLEFECFRVDSFVSRYNKFTRRSENLIAEREALPF